MPQGRGSLTMLFWVIVLGGALLYAVVALMDPWSLHIGGRWTPFLTWHGIRQARYERWGCIVEIGCLYAPPSLGGGGEPVAHRQVELFAHSRVRGAGQRALSPMAR